MATTRNQAPSEHQNAMKEAARIAAALTRAENSPARAIVLSSNPTLTRSSAFAAFDGTADSFTEGCAIAEVPMALNGPDLTMGIDGHQLIAKMRDDPWTAVVVIVEIEDADRGFRLEELEVIAAKADELMTEAMHSVGKWRNRNRTLYIFHWSSHPLVETTPAIPNASLEAAQIATNIMVEREHSSYVIVRASKNRSNVNTAVLAALSATDSLDDGDPIIHVEVMLDDNGPRITGDLDAIVKQAGDHQNAAVIFDIACVDPIADDEFDRTADATASAVSALLEEVFDEAGHYPFVGQNIYIFTEPTVD